MSSAGASTTSLDAAPEDRSFAVRAIASGCALGAVLAVSNLFVGLKTGWWESGAVLGAVVGARALGGRARTRDVVATQSIAMAAGAAPAAAGLLGIVPAMAIDGRAPGALAILLFGIGTSFFGITLAAALAPALLDRERLPFPTGEAAASAARSISGGSTLREGRAILGGSAVSALGVLLRDVLGWLPAVSATRFGFGVAWSPMAWGIGMLIGVRAALGVALGSFGGHAWIELSGLGDADWRMWPGASLLAGAAVLESAFALRGLRARVSRRSGAGAAVVALSSLAAVLGAVALGFQPAQAAVGTLVAVLLAYACARTAGQTDVAPAGAVGQLAQVTLGASAGIGAGAAAGALSSGAAAQSAVSLWAYRTAQSLSHPRGGLLLLQLGGAVVGCLVAVPAYAILSTRIASDAFPAPSVTQWRLVETLLASGIPRDAVAPAACAFALGVVIAGVSRGRFARYMPSAVALGTGMLLPPPLAATILIGGLCATRQRSGGASLASGAIAGEAVTGLLVAFVAVAMFGT